MDPTTVIVLTKHLPYAYAQSGLAFSVIVFSVLFYVAATLDLNRRRSLEDGMHAQMPPVVSGLLLVLQLATLASALTLFDPTDAWWSASLDSTGVTVADPLGSADRGGSLAWNDVRTVRVAPDKQHSDIRTMYLRGRDAALSLPVSELNRDENEIVCAVILSKVRQMPGSVAGLDRLCQDKNWGEGPAPISIASME